MPLVARIVYFLIFQVICYLHLSKIDSTKFYGKISYEQNWYIKKIKFSLKLM